MPAPEVTAAVEEISFSDILYSPFLTNLQNQQKPHDKPEIVNVHGRNEMVNSIKTEGNHRKNFVIWMQKDLKGIGVNFGLTAC